MVFRTRGVALTNRLPRPYQCKQIQEAIDQCAALALATVPAAPAQAASTAAGEQEEQEQQEREEAQGRQQQAESEERIYALRFLREAVGRFTSLSVTRPELESAMAAFSARRPPPPTASARSSKQQQQQQQQPQQHKARPLVDRAVRPLLKLGFLARRVDSRTEEAYWFSAPELGRATAALPAGRKAILAALRRSRYKELSERNVQALDLNPRGSGVAAAVAGAALSPEFYVADLVGAKEVLAVDTSSGRFLRLPPGAATAASASASGRRTRGK